MQEELRYTSRYPTTDSVAYRGKGTQVILSDTQILAAIDRKNLEIIPYPDNRIGPASVDLTLDAMLLTFPPSASHWETLVVDPMLGPETSPSATPITLNAKAEGYKMYPGEWLLGATAEWIGLSRDLVGKLDGKSSLARLGLSVEDAGYVDPGWGGRLTLELKNNGPFVIILRAGMMICQLRLYECVPATVSYSERPESHYNESLGPVQALRGLTKIQHSYLDQYGRLRLRPQTGAEPLIKPGKISSETIQRRVWSDSPADPLPTDRMAKKDLVNSIGEILTDRVSMTRPREKQAAPLEPADLPDQDRAPVSPESEDL